MSSENPRESLALGPSPRPPPSAPPLCLVPGFTRRGQALEPLVLTQPGQVLGEQPDLPQENSANLAEGASKGRAPTPPWNYFLEGGPL